MAQSVTRASRELPLTRTHGQSIARTRGRSIVRIAADPDLSVVNSQFIMESRAV